MKENKNPPTLVLASSSQIRQKILKTSGVPFQLDEASIDEAGLRVSMKNEPFSEIALNIAKTKALQVSYKRPEEGVLVLAADQILAFEDQVFGKVSDRESLILRLKEWRGKRHYLYTANVLFYQGEQVWHFIDKAEMFVRNLSDDFIEEYSSNASDEELNTVGGYRIEKNGIQLFSKIKGDYTTILGLTILPTLEILRQWRVIKM